MGQVTITQISLTSALLSAKTVNVGQTFKLSVGVTEATDTYKFSEAPTLGHSKLDTSIKRQIDFTLHKV